MAAHRWSPRCPEAGAATSAGPREAVTVALPTVAGMFTARAFTVPGGLVYLALVRGAVDDGGPVLTRLHSECLTGDSLGSLRCDCGPQLNAALRLIAAENRGVLLYLTGQEGRGIGLVNKLLAYVQQDLGLDTVDANLRLGLPADRREYTQAAAVLRALGVRSVRLLTNNPDKVAGLRAHGVTVTAVVGMPVAAHTRNRRYLRTKQLRFGHLSPAGAEPAAAPDTPADVAALLGVVRPPAARPYLVVKYAQTMDGRIATGTGDSRWISGLAERRLSHAMRAACDAVLVGAGTVLQDDPRLTVRLVGGATPLRVVLDSTLRSPPGAAVFSTAAPTMVLTTGGADPGRRRALVQRGVAVREVPAGPQGVDLPAALSLLRATGVESLLVEGGARVITALLASRLVDRLVVSLSPTILGSGVEAVGPLGVHRVSDGIRLTDRRVCQVGDDLVLAWSVPPTPG